MIKGMIAVREEQQNSEKIKLVIRIWDQLAKYEETEKENKWLEDLLKILRSKYDNKSDKSEFVDSFANFVESLVKNEFNSNEEKLKTTIIKLSIYESSLE